jgi:hypothetical protein
MVDARSTLLLSLRAQAPVLPCIPLQLICHAPASMAIHLSCTHIHALHAGWSLPQKPAHQTPRHRPLACCLLPPTHQSM